MKGGILVISLFFIGCGFTQRYTIPQYPPGKDLVGPASKLRLHWCSTCSFLEDPDRQSVETGNYQVRIYSNKLHMPWIFLFPLFVWDNCFTTCGEGSRKSYRLNLAFTRKSPAIQLDYSRIRLMKEGKPVPFKAGEPEVRKSEGKDTEWITLEVDTWSKLGWGIDLDLTGIETNEAGPIIHLERYTTTTLGLFYLD